MQAGDPILNIPINVNGETFLIMFESSVVTEAYGVKVKIEGFLKTVIYYPHQLL